MKAIEIEGLYRVKENELPDLFETMSRAFGDYPKLSGMFPDPEEKNLAVKMVVEYYGRFDFMAGRFYSLDESIREGIAVLHSDDVAYTEENFKAAGSYNDNFRRCARELGESGVKRWFAFFDEVDRLESQLELPKEYIYVDFLAVAPEVQGEGRGGRLVDALIAKANELSLPIMLFTNGEKDVRFYEKHGFRVLAVTRSEEYSLENVYMVYGM
ncbi:MAG: GNAT family N-acetyltransferase [Lentihominibacter sp.]